MSDDIRWHDARSTTPPIVAHEESAYVVVRTKGEDMPAIGWWSEGSWVVPSADPDYEVEAWCPIPVEQ